MYHQFISYSTADGLDFARRLHDTLEADRPPINCWWDKHDLQPSLDWDTQIRDAIRDCDALLFLITADSVNEHCGCKVEWSKAISYKKAIIPLQMVTGVEAPFRLENRQRIDFTDSFEAGLARLRKHLEWRKSPAGELHLIEERLIDAERDLHRTPDAEHPRILKEIAELKEDYARQKKIVDDPVGAARDTERSIQARLELERRPAHEPATRTKFINPPPGIAPTYFQDRHVETEQIADFLKDESLRLLTIVGRAGNGKTALVCRLLKALESGHLPDDLGPLPVDGIVYLSAVGSRRVSVPHLYPDLCRLLPETAAQALDALYRQPQASTEDKMRALLEHFPAGRVVLLLDNFEDVVDAATFKITDEELDEALRALLKLPQHAVKVILTTRIKPLDLSLFQPGRQRSIELDEGLKSPHAENILRGMDHDGTVGLRDLPPDHALLGEARERTCGYPRALEALYGILSADRNTSLAEMLDDIRRREAADGTAKLLPENVVEAMVGEAVNRLDAEARLVMQAVAIYGRPVAPVAVDYLLQPHRPGINSAGVLGRLVNMRFARKESGTYYLHPVDRVYGVGLIPRGERTEEDVFTQIALSARGADYFRSARKPRAEWKKITDLEAQLAEIDLRCAAEDYDTAADVLTDIDFDYLLLWGQLRLMAELHERLQGKISDPALKRISVGNLGTVYRNMGRVREAIPCYESALASAREAKNRGAEGAWLGNLGNAYTNLGQVQRAIDYYEQALVISREIGDRRGEGNHLGSLGIAYKNLGQAQRAIEFYEQALAIDREIGDRRGEGADLGNLGNAYSNLGQVQRAIDYYEQALAIQREIGNTSGASTRLTNIGYAQLASGKWLAAVQVCREAIQIADEIGYVMIQNWGRSALAEAYLHSGDLPAARETIQAARQYDVPLNNYSVLALLGVIAQRQGDHAAARAAFAESIAACDGLLAHTDQNYDALYAKGLALCGLSLTPNQGPIPADSPSLRSGEGAGGEAQNQGEQRRVPTEFANRAISAYRAARAITAAPGVVASALQIFDALAVADSAGVLVGVRQVIAGEES